jgi:hypothetical protein
MQTAGGSCNREKGQNIATDSGWNLGAPPPKNHYPEEAALFGVSPRALGHKNRHNWHVLNVFGQRFRNLELHSSDSVT